MEPLFLLQAPMFVRVFGYIMVGQLTHGEDVVSAASYSPNIPVIAECF